MLHADSADLYGGLKVPNWTTQFPSDPFEVLGTGELVNILPNAQGEGGGSMMQYDKLF